MNRLQVFLVLSFVLLAVQLILLFVLPQASLQANAINRSFNWSFTSFNQERVRENVVFFPSDWLYANETLQALNSFYYCDEWTRAFSQFSFRNLSIEPKEHFQEDCGTPGWLGCYDGANNKAFVNQTTEVEETRDTVMHETAHYLIDELHADFNLHEFGWQSQEFSSWYYQHCNGGALP